MTAHDTFETVGPLEVNTEESGSGMQETVEFETIAGDNNTDSQGTLPVGLITSGILVIAAITAFVAVRMWLGKKNTAATKKKIKVSSANRKFEERREEENNNLDKYATKYLSQFNFSDDGQKNEQFVLRDLYQDEKAIKDKEKERELEKEKDIYGFFEDDSETIERNKKKAEKVNKIKEEIDNGLTDDIDDYFNGQDEEWTYEDEDLKHEAAETVTDDKIDEFDNDFFDAVKEAEETGDMRDVEDGMDTTEKESVNEVNEKPQMPPKTEPLKKEEIPLWMQPSDDDDFI